MSQEVYLLNMFSEYQPPEALQDALSQAAIVAADLDASLGSIHVAAHAPNYIPKRLIDQAEKEISRLYGLRNLSITVTHPEDQLHCIEDEELRDLFVEKNSMNRGSLAGAQWIWSDTDLTVKLAANGKKELEECIPAIQTHLRERFAAPVTIRIEAGSTLEGQALFEAMDSMRYQLMKERPAAAPAKEKEKPAAVQSEAFYGKPFRGNATPMKDLNLDMGSVIVEGKVFAMEHKELKKRNAWVISFDMTDNYGSVRINRFLEAKEAQPILDNVKIGSVLKVQGRLELNRYDNELVLKPFAMMPGTMAKRKDTAEGPKRVELHLHTTMSNMDALTSTKAAIKQAAAWGHRAIAITDHGCCQSFTDALHVVEDWKGPPKVAGTDDTIKILYGCEGYYVNDVDDRIVVHGTQDMTFDQEFVAFDLETTGLSSKTDRIIEIGAVVMKNGQEVGSGTEAGPEDRRPDGYYR